MATPYSPPCWPFGVPYLAPLPEKDEQLFRQQWAETVQRGARNDSAAAGVSHKGEGGGAPGDDKRVVHNDVDDRPEDYHIEDAETCFALLQRLHVPLAPLTAPAGSQSYHRAMHWLEQVVDSTVTFTGELQTRGKLGFGQVQQILMRLRSAMLLHANGLGPSEAVQAQIIRETTGTTESTAQHRGSAVAAGSNHHGDGATSTPGGSRRSSHAAGGSAFRSLARMAMSTTTRRRRGSMVGVPHGSLPAHAAPTLKRHPVHDIDADPAFWFGPADLIPTAFSRVGDCGEADDRFADDVSMDASTRSSVVKRRRPASGAQVRQRVSMATLDAFVAVGGAPDGTGTVPKGRLMKLLRGTGVDVEATVGAEHAASKGQLSDDENDGDDDGVRHTLEELDGLLRMGPLAMLSKHDGAGGVTFDALNTSDGFDDSVEVSKGGTRRQTLWSVASRASRQHEASVRGSVDPHSSSTGPTAHDASKQLEYRVTKSGKFVLQPWVKRPEHVTHWRMEREETSSWAQQPAPVGGKSRRERRRDKANGVSAKEMTNATASQPTVAASAAASRVNSAQPRRRRGKAPRGRGIKLLRAMVAQEAEPTLEELVAMDDEDVDDDDVSSVSSDGGSTSSDCEDDREVAARYRTMQLPHIYGNSPAPGNGDVSRALREVTAVERRGKFSTASNTKRTVDVNRAAAMARLQKQQAAAEEEARRLEAERRRRLAGGHSPTEAMDGDFAKGQPSALPVSVTPEPLVKPKRRPSVQGTMQLAQKLLGELEASPIRRALQDRAAERRSVPLHVSPAATPSKMLATTPTPQSPAKAKGTKRNRIVALLPPQ